MDFHGKLSLDGVKIPAPGLRIFYKGLTLGSKVTVSGRLLAKVPPGLSTKPNETFAVG